jgi:hypothetical protein
VPDDFGLIECAKCGAPLIVHMDGRVEHSGVQLDGEQTPEQFEFEEQPHEFEAADFSAAEEAPAEEISSAVEEAPPPLPSTNDTASPDLSDIAQFGNSETSSAREGSLRYNLFIAGIDTADVREAFREAITDRKMVWDTEQILRSIKNGEVQLRDISPVKAFILVSRLRELPVRVRWEQYAIAQT